MIDWGVIKMRSTTQLEFKLAGGHYESRVINWTSDGPAIDLGGHTVNGRFLLKTYRFPKLSGWLTADKFANVVLPSECRCCNDHGRRLQPGVSRVVNDKHVDLLVCPVEGCTVALWVHGGIMGTTSTPASRELRAARKDVFESMQRKDEVALGIVRRMRDLRSAGGVLFPEGEDVRWSIGLLNMTECCYVLQREIVAEEPDVEVVRGVVQQRAARRVLDL